MTTDKAFLRLVELLCELSFDVIKGINEGSPIWIFATFAPSLPWQRNFPSDGRPSVCTSASHRSAVRSRLWKRNLAYGCWSVTAAAGLLSRTPVKLFWRMPD